MTWRGITSAQRFDAYARRARLSPGLLILLGPASLLVGSGLAENPLVASLGGLVATFGGALVLAEWIRRPGQQLERRAWRDSGGNPVAVELAANRDTPVGRRRLARLESATGLALLEDESCDTAMSLHHAVRRLVTAANRQRATYPRVFEELCNYGFVRNALAVRRLRVSVSLVSALLGSGALIVLTISEREGPLVGIAVGTVLSVFSALGWALFPTRKRMIRASLDYRDRLLEALDDGVLDVAGPSEGDSAG